MAAFEQNAATLFAHLVAFRDNVQTHRPLAVQTLSSLNVLMTSIVEKFNLDVADRRGQKREMPSGSGQIQQLKRRLRSADSRADKLEAHIEKNL